MKNIIQNLLTVLAIFAGINHAAAQGTAFTYQGRFNDGTNPATGNYDLRFTIYDAVTGGTAHGALTNAATGITNGLFTATLDFGGVFNGANYWLELAARTNGGGAFTPLSPRQQVLPTPYAIYAANAGNAGSVAAANIVGTVPLAQLPAAVVTNNETGLSLNGTFSGNGGGLTNLPAASLTGAVADSLLSSNIARLNIPNTTVQATATAVVTAGFITGTANLNGGSGYTNNPLVTLTDATGSNAVITATVSNGVVTNLTVQNAGSHYSAAATLTIALPPSNAYQTYNCGNVFNGVSTFNNASNIFTGSFTGNGAGLTNVNLTGPSASSALGSEANGYLALAANTIGYQNTANGYQALLHNTNGYQNTANGYEALQNNTTGIQNAANGAQALQSNTTGNYNEASGFIALGANTTGTGNSANGAGALQFNTTGSYNTANGWQALISNSSGSYNSANGVQALFDNTTGQFNVANGWLSLYFNTTGNGNVANGPHTLYSNTTGSYNVANGDTSLYSNTNGGNNTANGVKSLYANTTGSYNAAYGAQSLYTSTIGSNNIAMGYNAGYNLTTGSSNIDIGNMGLATDTNIIRIGSGQTQAFIAGVINGNGGGLTNLNAASLMGTAALPVGVLPANVALLNSNQTFTGLNAFSTNVAIGVASTPERFEVNGTDTAFSPGCSIRIHNTFDPVGGFIGDGWWAIQFGMYNPSSSSVGVIAAGAKRSFFGFDYTGKVGSLANNFANPSYRNLLDDGSGNMSIAGVITGNGAGLTNLNLTGPTASSALANTANGYQALLSNTTGSQNVANGYQALEFDTTGWENTANGMAALQLNTTGSYNVANGEGALLDNTVGNYNTANGQLALWQNISGSQNTANGASALKLNTNGIGNTANGYAALNNNTSGNYNIAEGYQAGYNIATGSSNIDIGNMGLVTDTNIIRIGTSQTQAFIAGQIVGDGSGLTNLNVGQLPSAVLTNNASGVNLAGTFSGDGSGLYNTITTANYVSAYDTANHLNSTANTFQSVSFGAASLSGWTYIGGGAATFTCPQSGMYLVQYTAEAATTINSATTISLRVFNLATSFETPGSESSVVLSVANQATPVSKSFLAYYAVGNAIQIQFTGSNTSAELIGGIGASTYQPSISCTIIRIQ